MKHIAVIGGGFAGLSAAVRLSHQGHRVTLLERRRHLGGRAYSFTDPTTGDTVDNGQHLFMKCYRATREFLSLIGASENLHFQSRFAIDFHHPQQGDVRLSIPRYLPRPCNLLVGFMRFKAIGFSDALALRHLDLKTDVPPDLSVANWLSQNQQPPRLRTAFWYPLCLAALNEPPERAPAHLLQAVLREAFFGPSDGANIGFSRTGLSALYTHQAQTFVEAHGGSVRLGTAISSLDLDPLTLHLRSGEILRPDACICAVTPPALSKLLPPNALPELGRILAQFQPSPILSVNLWFDRPIASPPFVGLLGGQMEWLFNKPLIFGKSDRASEGHIALVASAAHHLADRSEAALITLARRELADVLPATRNARLRHARTVCEHRATYSLPLGQPPPGTVTKHPALFLAGDWTDTGLPGTIESAVRSGFSAADVLSAQAT